MKVRITILVWQRLQYVADEQPGMPTYRVAGTITGVPSSRPDDKPRAFIGDVSVEIDGRDGEYKHLAGFHIPTEGPLAAAVWEAMMLAMSEVASLTAEMAAEAERYYGVSR